MSRARKFGAVLALALGIAAVASAPALSTSFAVPASKLTRFELAGSNGYRVEVTIGHLSRLVTVTTSKGGAETSYSQRGQRHGRAIRARFAGLGVVDVALRTRGKRRPVPNILEGCEGPQFARSAVARGRVAFDGEQGYTRVRAHRLRAEVLGWPRQRCRVETPLLGLNDKQRAPTLMAVAFTPSLISFTATKLGPGHRSPTRRAEFDVTVFDERPGVEIVHKAKVFGGLSTFRVPAAKTAPENFVLTPPAPFTGSAVFQRTAESEFTWKGDLAVTFPGTGPVRLISSEMMVIYCALRGCAGRLGELSF